MKRLALLFALLVVAIPASAENLYVRATGTELKGAGSPGGATVAKLDIGAKCDVVAKQGNWVQVKVEVKGKPMTGFVFAPKLSKDKPNKERLGGKTVASASEGDTASALRGLSPTAEGFAGRSAIKPQDIAAVKKMEEQKIAEGELATFLREGKLGEFMK